MASKALTKEVRGIVSKKTSAVRKRAVEQFESQKVAGAVGATVGAVGAALVDGTAKGGVRTFKAFGVKVPHNLAGGLGLAAVGFFIRGEVGTGLMGGGMTAANCAVYEAIRTKTAKRKAKEADDDESDDDESED